MTNSMINLLITGNNIIIHLKVYIVFLLMQKSCYNQKISIKIEGNEVYSLDDVDVYNCFKDLWLIKRQLENLTY